MGDGSRPRKKAPVWGKGADPAQEKSISLGDGSRPRKKAPKSLQEECMIIIIKQDLARNLLPDIVEEEVDLYEREISGFSSFPVVFKEFKPR